VRRHVAGLPVSARPDTWVYRTQKFLGRNRAGAAAAALFILLLIAFSLAMRTQAARTARERDVALREADKAARVSSFMSEMFFLADPGQARGENVTVREALDSGRAWIGRELTGHPELSVEMGRQLGEVYYRLGNYQEAREVWESARAVGIEHGGEFQESVLRVTLVLVKALEDLGRSDSAEVLARRALVIQQQLPELRDDAFTTTHILLRLGRVLRHQGRLEEAETVLRRALTILPETHPDASHRRTVLVTALSHVRRAAGDPMGAERLLRGILETRRATFGEEHPEVAQVLMNLGLTLADQGRYAEAETLARQGLEMYRRVLGESHPDVALGVESLAYVLHRKGDVAAAAELYGRALELQPRSLPPDHPRRAAALFGLGLALLDQERRSEAEPLLREALQLRRGVTGDGPPGIGEIQAALEAARTPRPNP